MDYNDYCTLLDEGEIEINTNGHAARTGSRDFRLILMIHSVESAEAIAERINGGNNWEPQLKFPIVEEDSYSFQCGKCGKRPTVTFYEDRIEFEDNHVEPEPFSVDIEFLSGEMVFDDTYPAVFDRVDTDFDVNTVAGVQECSEHMAKQGLMHFFVGNSCPTVWKEGDVIFVGRIPDDDCGMRVGSICTDLWWVSFVDPALVLKMNGGQVGEVEYMHKKGGATKVTPGTYRCTSYYHLGNIDYCSDEKQVFCKLEKIQ